MCIALIDFYWLVGKRKGQLAESLPLFSSNLAQCHLDALSLYLLIPFLSLKELFFLNSRIKRKVHIPLLRLFIVKSLQNCSQDNLCFFKLPVLNYFWASHPLSACASHPLESTYHCEACIPPHGSEHICKNSKWISFLLISFGWLLSLEITGRNLLISNLW